MSGPTSIRCGPVAGLVLALLGGLLTAGCGGGAAPAAAGEAVETTAERGPVSVTVRADRDRISVGEKLQVSVAVTFDAGVDVRMPEFEDELGSFTVRSRLTPRDAPEGERRRWVHTWIVDTFAAGTLEVPVMRVQFTDRRAGDMIATAIETETLVIEVDSVLTGNEAETDFRDLHEAVTVPLAARRWPWVVAVAAVLVMAGVVAILRRRRGRAAIALPEPVVPPHVWALRMLDALAADELIERGESYAFYARLSDIARQYIERRFAIMAPERTTEEFLREARRSNVLEERHKSLLAEFLRAADMVKFARHDPTPDEAERAFGAARGFVEQTAPPPPPISAQEAAA